MADPPATQALCAAVLAGGYRIFFVGGCVRNAVLGEPVGDLDLATDALPEQVIRLAEAAGFKAIPTGIDHGTVTVLADGVPHEITTFRHDVQTDGRHAVVAYSTDLAQDAARRDFTMNALYADPAGEVIDPLGGLPDLLARRLRFVGDPVQRIGEDYLRILRFFRFSATYGDPALGMDVDALAACAELADGIDGLSRERIGAETVSYTHLRAHETG
jgi:poly(A) polymerase